MFKDIIQFCQSKYTATGIFFILTLLLFMSFTLSASVRAADDNYLKELEVEAENSANVSNKISNSSNTSSKASPNQKEFKNFESEMKSRRPAIYRFYKKLNKEDKTIIFSIYQEDHKFTRASKVVFDLYFDKNK
ncbi:hypothetical protein [Kaarinaea lacus]